MFNVNNLRNDIKIKYAMIERVRQYIKDCNGNCSMRNISEVCLDVLDKFRDDLSIDANSVQILNEVELASYAYYIIYCETYYKIPVSGY